MAVMEVELPSGYVADVDALPSITRSKVVKRIDTANGDTNVVIYFDRVSIYHSKKQHCVLQIEKTLSHTDTTRFLLKQQ